jgi:hypothetical protein
MHVMNLEETIASTCYNYKTTLPTQNKSVSESKQLQRNQELVRKTNWKMQVKLELEVQIKHDIVLTRHDLWMATGCQLNYKLPHISRL